MLNICENIQAFYSVEENLKQNINIIESQLKSFENSCDLGYMQNKAMIKVLRDLVIESKNNYNNFIKNCPFY